MRALVVMLIAACSTQEPEQDNAVQPTPSEGMSCPGSTPSSDDTGILEPDTIDALGSCTESSDACEPLSGRELLRADGFGGVSPFPVGNRAVVIATQDDWDTWWTDNAQGERPNVDFTSEQVLIAGYVVNASCHTGILDTRLEQCGDTVRLTVNAEDRSGTCFSTCDAEGAAIVAVAVSNTLAGESCATVCRSCQ